MKNIYYLILYKWMLFVAVQQQLTDAQSCDVTSWGLVRCTKVNSLEEFKNGIKNCSGKTQEMLIQNSDLNYLTPQVFEDFNNLKILRLLSNKITSLPAGLFEKLKKIEVITANYNLIQYLDGQVFLGLKTLKKLYFTSNKIKFNLAQDLFDHVDSMIALDLGNNAVEEIKFNAFINNNRSSLDNLTYLSLERNKLEILKENSFKALNKLNNLRLEKNRLTNINLGAFAGLSSLIFLDLSSNKIESLPDGLFSDTPNLKYLYLYNNKFQTLSPYTFEGLKNLQTLYLQNNTIKIVKLNMFKKLKNLKKLHIFGNNILNVSSDFLENLTLNELYLDENNLEELKEFLPFSDIKDVRFYDNQSKQLKNVNRSIHNYYFVV